MDKIDKKILDRIQSDFPLQKRPFRVLSDELGLDEDVLIDRVRRLVDDGYVRRIGPIINSRGIGLIGTLVAMKVSEKRVSEVADFVSDFDEVSHNYRRDHEYNVWFTVLAESRDRIEEILDEVRARDGVRGVIELPSKEMFKIGVSFSLSEE